MIKEYPLHMLVMSASSSRGVIAAAGDLHLLRPCPSRTISRWLLCLLVFFLGGTVVVGDKTAADYFVKSLPGQPEGPLLKMHAGSVSQCLPVRLLD